MGNCEYKRLFEPIRLGDTLFRNRIFASATGYQDFTGEGFLPLEAVAYYERKAIGGAAAVTVGECVVDSKRGKGADYHATLDNPLAEHSYQRLANAVSRQGAVASAELQHAGMFANRAKGREGVAYGPVAGDINGKPVYAMDEELIAETIEIYARAAMFAKHCGFGMVTVHAGHGWLLSQFISPIVNTRRDRWGGSIENRMRLPVAIADAIHKACGSGFPIEMRISGSECHEEGYDIEEGIKIAKQLDGHVDLIHVSAGSHEVDKVFTVTHPSMFLDDGCNVKFAAEIKKHVKTPVATVGALTDARQMEEIIASGQADVVELARGLIAEPDLPNKIRAGKEREAKTCMRCLHCFSTLINEGQFYCAINPTSGRELEYKSDIPPKFKKKVLVAGGGIGGMQAALTCAERGHEVILCEKTDSLGGVLLCETNVPFKKKLHEYIEFQKAAIAKANIDVRLSTEVTPELAAQLAPDALIAALGARPAVPNIPGIDRGNVLSAEDAYINPDKTGKKVTILGGGLVGVELAIYLSQQGREVTVVEMMDSLRDGGNMMHMRGIEVELDRYGIAVSLNTKALEILHNGVICDRGGENLTINADTIIYAVGQVPLSGAATELGYFAPEFYRIGDCDQPKSIMNATATAFTVAREIGRHF